MPLVMAIWGVLSAAFSRLVSTRIGQWIGSAMLFFGVQFVASKFVAAPIKSGLAVAFGGMTSDVLAWVGFLNVDSALTIILSAYASVSLTRLAMVKKGP